MEHIMMLRQQCHQINEVILMADTKRDLLSLQYSRIIGIQGIQEQVVDLSLEEAQNIETTISGTVTDNGTPIAGATVKVFDKDGTPFMHTLTSQEGNYYFENLPAGTYSVAVAQKGYRLSQAAATTLSAGDTATLNFSMEKDETLALGTVTGVLTTGSGINKAPVADAKVTMVLEDNTVFAVTYTVSDGEFAFYDLPDGQYQIIATGEGYSPSMGVVVTITNGNIINTNISITPDEVRNTGTFNGVITNKQGQAVSGCFVGLYQIQTAENGTVQEFLVARTKTNATGKYLFGNVAAGNYIVKAKMNA